MLKLRPKRISQQVFQVSSSWDILWPGDLSSVHVLHIYLSLGWSFEDHLLFTRINSTVFFSVFSVPTEDRNLGFLTPAGNMMGSTRQSFGEYHQGKFAGHSFSSFWLVPDGPSNSDLRIHEWDWSFHGQASWWHSDFFRCWKGCRSYADHVSFKIMTRTLWVINYES